MIALAQDVTPDPVARIENYFARLATLLPQPARPAEPVSAQLQAALDYAARGWLVIPLHTPTARGCSCGRADCQSVGKHPRTRNGSKDASRDPAVIHEWWKRWPDANVGIATGPESGILVLDIDGKQGEQSLIDLAQRGFALPDTYTVRTGSGGQHHYFDWPEGTDVRNSARKIAPGLDIRGVGGLVAAPPSLHKSGRRYEVNESATDPAPCPEWLLSLIQAPQGAQAKQSAQANASIVKGQRTPHLVSLAGTMHKRNMDPAAIEAALLQENLAKCNPPLPSEKVCKIAHEIPKRYPNPESEAHAPATLTADIVCLKDVPAKAVDWLWEPLIPTGMLSMLSGDPGSGKSFIALSICADLSRGKLRDSRIVEPANSLYLSIENPVAETIRPRFDAMGGDPSRLFMLRGSTFTVDGEQQHGAVSLADIPVIDAALTQTHAKILVVDPVQSYLGQNVDMHRANQTRPILDNLSKLAEAHGCAVLILRHLSKQGNSKAITRGLGSIDLTGAVRSEMLVGSLPDDEDCRAMIHVKSNVGRLAHSLGYEISDTGEFRWTGESSITAFDLLAAPEGPDRKLTEATQWLAEKLKAGSAEKEEVCKQAESAGIRYRTLQRAKSALRVQSRRATFGGGSIWSLPENEPGSEAVR